MSGAGQPPLRPRHDRRVPRWVKLAAVPIALAVVAGLNLHAAAAERRRARAAADQVAATAVQAGGVANRGDFTLGVVITNNGPRPLRLRAPRLVPATYVVRGASAGAVVAPGSSAQVQVDLQARCPVPAGAGLRIVLPVVASSGRVVDVGVDTDRGFVDGLAHGACGEVPVLDSVLVVIGPVRSATYGVSFVMHVANGSSDTFALTNLSSPGLSFAVQGGTPVTVPADGEVSLRVTAQLPACSLLPSPAVRAGSLRFGTMQLGLLDRHGLTKAAAYTPDPAERLYPALLALRSRICPGLVARDGAVRGRLRGSF